MPDMGGEWFSLMRAPTAGAKVQAAFDLPYPPMVEQDTFAQALALLDLGICCARIVADDYKAIAPKEIGAWSPAQRLSRTWRYAEADEDAQVALILPVTETEHDCTTTLSLHELDEDVFGASISDLIAIPIDGGRSFSFTGLTGAVGTFEVNAGTLQLRANGMTWLKAHLARVRKACADTPNHLVEQLCFPVAPPGGFATLVIDPHALDWRVTSPKCVIPTRAMQVDVLDSVGLAEAINALMRLRERERSLPIVRGPAVPAL